MKRVSLNFAPRRPAYWPSLLLIGAVMVLFFVWREYGLLREAADRVSQDARRVEQAERRARNGRVTVLPADFETRVVRARRILNQLAVPWDVLFAELESAGAEGISLLELRPDAERGAVTLLGEARDAATMLTYLARLELVPVFSKVYLQRHEAVTTESGRSLRFTIAASWKIDS